MMVWVGKVRLGNGRRGSVLSRENGRADTRRGEQGIGEEKDNGSL